MRLRRSSVCIAYTVASISCSLVSLRSRGISCCQSDPLDLAALATRIEAVKGRAPPEQARLLSFDSMVPGQVMELSAPAPFVDLLEREEAPLVMVAEATEDTAYWRVASSRSPPNLEAWPGDQAPLLSHGVLVEATVGARRPDRGADVVLRAKQRLCEVDDAGEAEGSLWLGRAGRVCWLELEGPQLDASERPTDALIARCAALEPLVDEWLGLVRYPGPERTPGQVDRILQQIGPMPPAELPSKRALWVAALLNPLPPLGVALEVRPACLIARSAEQRLAQAELALRDSLERLHKQAGGSGPFPGSWP